MGDLVGNYERKVLYLPVRPSIAFLPLARNSHPVLRDWLGIHRHAEARPSLSHLSVLVGVRTADRPPCLGRSQMVTFSLADTKQQPSITAGVLSREKAYACSQMSAILRACSIPDRDNYCRCSARADATYFGDTLTNVAPVVDSFDLLAKYLIFSLSCTRNTWSMPMISILGWLMKSSIAR
jgi:hypothetical protein